MELVQKMYFKNVNKTYNYYQFPYIFSVIIFQFSLLDPAPEKIRKKNADPDPQPWVIVYHLMFWLQPAELMASSRRPS